MSITAFKSPFALVVAVALLSGCGLTQSVVEGTKSATKSIFYKQITTLRLDFTGRAALNRDDQDMTALSVPTLVRVYQLRDGKALEKATYQSVLNEGDTLLQADLLAWREVVVKPGEGATLDMPLEKDAKFVAVVGMFRMPDTTKNTWRLVIPREQLEPDRARVIELGDNTLKLQPLKE